MRITRKQAENIASVLSEGLPYIRKFNNKSEIIRFNEEEIIKKNIIFFREISSDSLFNEKKVIFIDQASDKILDLIQEVEKIDLRKKSQKTFQLPLKNKLDKKQEKI